ncbi:hypothetical protein ANN_19812 [Periplaneta americana]|uniref:Uncharacterized protein n=1 Tax=Periplaneta americana TaxID=6978 RepID=A0ABQ8SB42_PERAM|nr:hypothetical protein ANN_19812 [Periplaneta americana]
MAGLCEGGNEPPGSLKATFILRQESSAQSTLGLASLTRGKRSALSALVAASGYALYLSLLHDGAQGTAPRTHCTFQRLLTTTVLRDQHTRGIPI